MAKHVYTCAHIITLAHGQTDYGSLTEGAIAVADGQIVWVGPAPKLPPAYAAWPQQDFGERLVTPGLIDCHTHLVFAGNRAKEFELKLQGSSYADIARAGGGIVSTVQATRAASEEQLLAAALQRLDVMLAEGITTIEVKSGYGLDVATELRMLRVARQLATLRPVQVITSFLGAHALPPEFAKRPNDYIDLVCEQALPAVAAEQLADAVDGFCEHIGFTAQQIERVFDKAVQLGLPVKLHAEQLSDQGGAALAARYQAVSVDHLEYLSPAGVAAIAASGSVAVLLPGAFYALAETQRPPIAALRAAGIPMAVATDCNPGSSPLVSPLLAMNMACTLFRLTPLEALQGMTCQAAQALGLPPEVGRLQAGSPANLAVWNVSSPAELIANLGHRPLYQRIYKGISDATA